jgi:hypothetical protein
MEATERKALNQMERALLRQAVSKHASWDSWRQNVLDRDGKPVNTSTISIDQLHAAADAFGIDVDEVTANAGSVESKPKASYASRPSSNGQHTASNGSNDDDAQQLAKLLKAMLSKPAIDADAVRAIVQEELAGQQSSIRTILLPQASGEVAKLEGHFHPMFPTLLRAVATKQNVWISGPTGTGKTHAARQVAEALSKQLGRHIPFWYQGAMTQPHEFLGFVRVGDGVYQSTDLRQAFEHGGVCLLDECDSSDASVTLAIAGLLANGHAVFPDKVGGIPRHPDCYIIAAGNTWGTGATAEFVGRNRLDGAFMSRFPIKLPWSVDEAFELSLYPGDFTRKVQQARRKASDRGLKIIIDSRHMAAGNALLADGFTMDEAADMTYLASLSADDRKKLAS